MEIPQLRDPNWQWDLAFLTDICSHCNLLNIKLQGKDKLIFELLNDVTAFEGKLKLFVQHVNRHNFAHFPTCDKLRSTVPFPDPNSKRVLQS